MDASLVIACVELLIGPLQGAEATILKSMYVGHGDAIYIKMPIGDELSSIVSTKGKSMSRGMSFGWMSTVLLKRMNMKNTDD